MTPWYRKPAGSPKPSAFPARTPWRCWHPEAAAPCHFSGSAPPGNRHPFPAMTPARPVAPISPSPVISSAWMRSLGVLQLTDGQQASPWRTCAPWKLPFFQTTNPKREDCRTVRVLQPLLLFCPIIFASCVIHTRKRKGFRACGGATKGLSARPLETFGPVPCGNPCKLSSDRVHPHHAGYEKAPLSSSAASPAPQPRPPTSTGTPRCFSGERERGFSEKPPSRHGAGSSPAAGEADLLLHLAQRLIGAIGGLLRVGLDQILQIRLIGNDALVFPLQGLQGGDGAIGGAVLQLAVALPCHLLAEGFHATRAQGGQDAQQVGNAGLVLGVIAGSPRQESVAERASILASGSRQAHPAGPHRFPLGRTRHFLGGLLQAHDLRAHLRNVRSREW